jgi:hypothetical protein
MKNLLLLLLLAPIFSIQAQEKKTDSIPRWKIHGRFSFIFNQSSFTNWSSGGQNTVAGNININYDFNFKKDKLNWDSRIITGYGLSHLSDKGYRKTDDRFEFNSLLGLKINKLWFFSFFTNFKTQYTRGFDYTKVPEVSVSDFLSPAYLSFGPGLLWKKSDNMNLNIAPATSRFTFVSDLFSGQFGVEKGENTSFSLGFNLAGYFKFLIMKNVELENILAIYSDYLNKPENIDIENQINVRFTVNKHIKMHMTFHGILDDNASSSIQFRQLFGLGVNYSFHEKTTY